jgi:thioredoxin 1
MVHQVATSAELAAIIKDTKGQVVVVDYFATWCGPCVGFAPKFEAMSKEMPKVKFVKCDVDQCPEAAEEAQVQSIPSFHIYLNGSKQESFAGASEQKLRDAIAKAQTKV